MTRRRLEGCLVAVVASGTAAGPELATAVAGLSLAGAVVRSAGRHRGLHHYDALLLAPAAGALMAPARALLDAALDAGKPIAALGRGGLLALAAAGGLRGIRVAAPAGLEAYLASAGAQVTSTAAVADRGIVTGTGRAFVAALLTEFLAEYPGASKALSAQQPRVGSAVPSPVAPPPEQRAT